MKIDKIKYERKYYPNGKLKTLIPWSGWNLHGTQTEYYENGEVKSITNFKDDKMEGLSIGYASNGEIEYSLFYENGKVILNEVKNLNEKEMYLKMKQSANDDDFIRAIAFKDTLKIIAPHMLMENKTNKDRKIKMENLNKENKKTELEKYGWVKVEASELKLSTLYERDETGEKFKFEAGVSKDGDSLVFHGIDLYRPKTKYEKQEEQKLFLNGKIYEEDIRQEWKVIEHYTTYAKALTISNLTTLFDERTTEIMQDIESEREDMNEEEADNEKQKSSFRMKM